MNTQAKNESLSAVTLKSLQILYTPMINNFGSKAIQNKREW